MAAPRKFGPIAGNGLLGLVRRLLFVAGVVLIAVYVIARLHTEITSRAAIRQFAMAAQKASEANRKPGDALAAKNDIDFNLWSMKRITAYEESLTRTFDPPLAILGIPKIGVEVPVFDGTDDLTLNRGVGRISGTARPGSAGNVGIAGHRDGFFRGLKDMQVGDSIELQTLQGKELYRVDQIRIVKPTDVQVLADRGIPAITLVTCYPFYYIGNAPQRFVVQGTLQGTTSKERQTAHPIQ